MSSLLTSVALIYFEGSYVKSLPFYQCGAKKRKVLLTQRTEDHLNADTIK